MSVSVVIPTFERADMLLEALDSVRAQSRPVAQIVVVVDGTEPDPATLQALDAFDDPRLDVVVPRRRLGNAGARNAGIAVATGHWIALLDDDDLWHPDKLARQLDLLDAAPDDGTVPIACSRLEACFGERRYRWPRLLPGRHESVAHYLFCRRWPVAGDRLVQTSTLVAERTLFQAIPFRYGRRFVDQDWLLRVAAQRSVRLLFPVGRDALVQWRHDEARPQVGKYRDWRWSMVWARHRANLLGPRAHAAFVLTLASASAAERGDREAFLPLLVEAFRYGRPNLAELGSHLLNFGVSSRCRAWLAGPVNRWRRP